MICRFLNLLIALFCLAFTLYAGRAEASSNMNPKISLDINSNGKRIEVKVGDEIQIELKAMGGAGYAWYFDNLNQEFFELLKEERKASAPEKRDLVGTPVLTIWKLRAKKPGSSSIRMLYYRQWEGKDRADNRFEVIVDIIP